MFEWLENIWNAIKVFFGFFGSILRYIEDGFSLIGSVIRYPIDAITSMTQYIPPLIISIMVACLLVWVIRTIVGRGE